MAHPKRLKKENHRVVRALFLNVWDEPYLVLLREAHFLTEPRLICYTLTQLEENLVLQVATHRTE